MIRTGPNMNIHITWLTHVRTGPKKKIATRAKGLGGGGGGGGG